MNAASPVDLFGEKILPPKSKIRAVNKGDKPKESHGNYRSLNDEPNFFITPQFSLHPDELYIYGKKEWINYPDLKHDNSLINLNDNSTHGKLSANATKKAKRAIKYLLLQANTKKVFNPKFRTQFDFKVNFITLTLPSTQRHSSQILKRELLNQFFVEAKRKWKLENYVWRIEKQKNGNDHWHILTDKFIPWSELREVWNRICEKLGYVTAFREKTHKKSPNSTDIHSLKKVKDVYKYVTKYMTKPKRSQPIKIKRSESLRGINRELTDEVIKELSMNNYKSVSYGAKRFLGQMSGNGREWACSRSLSNLTGAQYEYDSEYKEEIEKLRKAGKTKEVVKDYVSMYYFQTTELNERDYPKLSALLASYMHLIFPDPPEVRVDSTGSVYNIPIFVHLNN
jgi:hypothetical protein